MKTGTTALQDLERPYLDLETQRRGLIEALNTIDLHRRELKRRITAEGEAAKREWRSANKARIDHWKGVCPTFHTGGTPAI